MAGQPWTEEEAAFLRQCVEAKLPATKIANALQEKFGRKITKNAVISRGHRMGLDMNGPKMNLAQKQQKTRVIRSARAGQVLVRRPSFAPQFASAPLPRPRAPDPDPVLGPDGKPHRLETLPAKGCKWILNDDMKQAEYCGNDRAGVGPYCGAHTARAWRRPAPNEQEEAA